MHGTDLPSVWLVSAAAVAVEALEPFVVEYTLLKACTNNREIIEEKKQEVQNERKASLIDQW